MVEYEVQGQTAIITIDRPDARNAINPQVAAAIESSLDAAESDDSVRSTIVSGSGPVFCAGADLKAIQAGDGPRLFTARGGFAGVTRRARAKPLIAAVDGPALAGGLEIVLSCDIVVASTRATFGLPEVKRGLVAAGGGLLRLQQRIPFNIALEMQMTGDPKAAVDMYKRGLVNLLCEPGEAVAVAMTVAQRIAANAPLAVRESRRVAIGSFVGSEEQGWKLSADSDARVLASDDVQEGLQAFIDKRQPIWSGR